MGLLTAPDRLKRDWADIGLNRDLENPRAGENFCTAAPPPVHRLDPGSSMWKTDTLAVE